VHHWLSELSKELEERVTADRKEWQRIPKLLTVHIDSPTSKPTLPTPSFTPHSATAADAGAGTGTGTAAGGGGGGSNPWRMNVTGHSRSCALRRVSADALAEDALALVRKWSADRWVGGCCRLLLLLIQTTD
jgi:hypothetical protein